MKYEAVIGLEIHVELKTESKIFCSCRAAFGAEPNTHVCPVCLGLPGTLPVLNRRAVEYAIMAALALNCEITPYCKFDRKNYFYPDLPKNYQISQFDLPLAQNGYLEIDTPSGPKRVGIVRLHLEEDAGKLVHVQSGSSSYALVDYNRAGVPLIEIVSAPDLRSPEEARAYAEKLRQIMLYLGVSDCKMEEGSLRVDANISVRPAGSDVLGVKTEIKNVNSFRSLSRALAYEIERHVACLERGEKIVQETRGWDEERGVTFSMRSKEEAHDYRYFPEPDLPPLVIDAEWVESLRKALPELPDAKRRRFIEEYGLPENAATVLTATPEVADYFEETLKFYPQPRQVANWVMVELARCLNAAGISITASPVKPQALAQLLKLMDAGIISGKIAKDIFEEMFATGKDAESIVKEKGLTQITDEETIRQVVREVIAANPKVVADYKGGKEKALSFLVGQVMKATRGRANPGLVNQLLKEELSRE
ncbi:Asp-tRNA(Asn)/Glu-tRNA(Gln) amidotransferase subunit GatB [Ammonifex thiophilus]|uniref:Aspartyl/glutamyl-tRNA(Asn/Gln) amidotransferase subunit B n=1 Tax=Ammonifex thiophilus TaxID=444093 RepID=A0A3D8P4E6_9THEO|nr:Asp-tRNA(Asn)/Glu-tRNA(Gln) amidotransferase subunit GatB [Ammonifex thiophilus]RDV84022.1 Asp-tRNA(Asn)/Glu-tRNA(Gln) amidotransferase subunit GatB [Ammonifex thiophilus]